LFHFEQTDAKDTKYLFLPMLLQGEILAARSCWGATHMRTAAPATPSVRKTNILGTGLLVEEIPSFLDVFCLFRFVLVSCYFACGSG
jgi:hypothetical protein